MCIIETELYSIQHQHRKAARFEKELELIAILREQLPIHDVRVAHFIISEVPFTTISYCIVNCMTHEHMFLDYLDTVAEFIVRELS